MSTKTYYAVPDGEEKAAFKITEEQAQLAVDAGYVVFSVADDIAEADDDAFIDE